MAEPDPVAESDLMEESNLMENAAHRQDVHAVTGNRLHAGAFGPTVPTRSTTDSAADGRSWGGQNLAMGGRG